MNLSTSHSRIKTYIGLRGRTPPIRTPAERSRIRRAGFGACPGMDIQAFDCMGCSGCGFGGFDLGNFFTQTIIPTLIPAALGVVAATTKLPELKAITGSLAISTQQSFAAAAQNTSMQKVAEAQIKANQDIANAAIASQERIAQIQANAPVQMAQAQAQIAQIQANAQNQIATINAPTSQPVTQARIDSATAANIAVTNQAQQRIDSTMYQQALASGRKIYTSPTTGMRYVLSDDGSVVPIDNNGTISAAATTQSPASFAQQADSILSAVANQAKSILDQMQAKVPSSPLPEVTAGKTPVPMLFGYPQQTVLIAAGIGLAIILITRK